MIASFDEVERLCDAWFMFAQRLVVICELDTVIVMAQALVFSWIDHVVSQSLDEGFRPGYDLQMRTFAAPCSISDLLFARVVIDREDILGFH